MRKWLTSGVIGLIVTGALVIKADEPDVDSHVKSFWMTQKLQVSQEILAALSMEDFDALAKNVTKMKRLSRLEGLARRSNTEEYGRQIRLFQRTVDILAEDAEEKHLDAAALAFSHMTLSCVNCHKHLRGVVPVDSQKVPTNEG